MEKRIVLEGTFKSSRDKYRASMRSTVILNIPKIARKLKSFKLFTVSI